ncbi:PREDICTED: HAUS augmin-like complex subunit 8 [Propithecus coquereli]|uniref:HAUS augmin-like complex subunit 8 n=1 Tax=Propithecus coquereli TaxID=379532 RepID=UPI00063EFF63|nr:PREDICTED: HAUS augmin-like complex subunit 8 [Propithecus coquereli]
MENGDQIEMLSPFEAVAERFKEQYKTFATALDATRHELPMRSIHLEGDGQQFLDALQSELKTTQKLLEDLGIGNSEENVQVLDLLGELKDVAVEKDLELRRHCTMREQPAGVAVVRVVEKVSVQEHLRHLVSPFSPLWSRF